MQEVDVNTHGPSQCVEIFIVGLFFIALTLLVGQ